MQCSRWRFSAASRSGTTDGEIEALIDRFKRDNGVVFTVATLEYLQKGGRIGKAQALAGALLSVKPILSVADGVVAPIGRVRGREKALAEFRRVFTEATQDEAGLRVAIAHADAPEWVDDISTLVHDARPQSRIAARPDGAVVGTPAPAGGACPALPLRPLWSGATVAERCASSDATSAPRRRRRAVRVLTSLRWRGSGAGWTSAGPGPILVPVTLTTSETRRTAGFGGMDPPASWPRPRSFPGPGSPRPRDRDAARCRPRRSRGRLAKLGLRTIGRPARSTARAGTSARSPERPIGELFGDDEAVIQGVVRGGVSGRRRRGRLHVLTARVGDDTGEIKATWFNQPWLEAKLVPGTALRLRGKPNRYGFQVESYDFGEATETADFAPVYPGQRGARRRSNCASIVDRALEHARAVSDPLPAALAAERGPAAAIRCTRGTPSPTLARGGRGRHGAGSRSTSC